MKAWRAAIVAWSLAAIVACATSTSTRAPTAPPVQAVPESRSDPHAQIEQLSADVDRDREQMGLSAPAAPSASEPIPQSAGAAGAASSKPLTSKTDPACHPAATDACTDTCTLADSICENAGKICDLAAQLAGDAWAAGKCTTAKQTCGTAHGKCCDCKA